MHEEQQEIEGLWGEDIRQFAERLVMAWEHAAIHRQETPEVFGVFNGITLAYRGDSTADAIVGVYRAESQARSDAYQRSPERQYQVWHAEVLRQHLQAHMDAAMVQLPTLNFSDLGDVIAWIEKILEPSNHVGVHTPAERIVATFQAHGYAPGVNCYGAFDQDDEENFARWLIGQALSNLESVGEIHQVFSTFAAQWRVRFRLV